MADTDGRNAKRRKLNNDTFVSLSSQPPNVVRPALSKTFPTGFLVLAQSKVEICDGGDHLLPADTTTSSESGWIDVVVQEVHIRSSNVIVKTAPKARSSHTLKVVINSKRDKQVLEDCQLLESFAKSKARGALPLACVLTTFNKTAEKEYLDIAILWQDSTSIREIVDVQLLDLLDRYLPGTVDTSTDPASWTPREFYDHVHVPEKSNANSTKIRIPFLESELFPFQRRAVRWLLSREGVGVRPDGAIEPLNISEQPLLPSGFQTTRTEDDTTCIANKALGLVSTDTEAVTAFYENVRGGILAEEMGLGKTLEIISLICLHRMPVEASAMQGLRQSSATLIITPATILEQWKQEIKEHAPALRVFHYKGITSFKKDGEEIMTKLLESDVVLTTYNVIGREIHYVHEKPDRKLRGGPRADSPKSPLTQVSWWRVCLDEAQMVESGVSSAAQVAMRIPRHNAWAVTGTPLRKGHKDLFGLFLFLRYEPWCQSLRIWEYLVDFQRPLLRRVLGQIAMRHTKDFVREDLRLPPQSRHTITIPFTAIEEQHYAQLFAEFCEECGLDQSGGPLTGDWDPTSSAVIEKMRSWLTRLRQTCLHPEVGQPNRRAFRRADNVLRTVDQVLDVMIDQVEGQLRSYQRLWLTDAIRRGQMKENAKQTEQALKIWQASYIESSTIVDQCRKQLDLELRLKNSLGMVDPKSEDTEDDEEENSQFTTLKSRLRSALEVKHVCIFFIANAFFQLKSLETPENETYLDLEKQETEAYEEAKSIRSELLAEVLRNANKLITNVGIRAADERAQIPDMEAPEEYSGIESLKIFDRLDAFCKAMNKQAAQFRDLQEQMLSFLRQGLLDQDEGIELQGDEYENSTKQQDEMYAYMEALRALFSDRGEALTGQENMLIRSEMKAFLRAAHDGMGPAPDVMIRLLAEREQKRVKWEELGSLRGIIGEIRATITSLEWQVDRGKSRASYELAIVTPVLESAMNLSSTQNKALNTLEQLVNQFRDTMNGRLEFYRALQKISDTVAPFQEETIGNPLNQRQYDDFLRDEVKSKDKIESLSTRLRYLIHLKTDSQSSNPRICTICQCDFEIGTLTVCGHQFCKDCILLWWNAHRNCPVCKRGLHLNSFYDITYKPAEVAVQAESPAESASMAGVGSDRPLDQSIYSDISTSMLNQIKSIDIRGPSFGSKVDFLCRHLLWLRQHDPGCKAIIFSQYREFLDVLGRAFRDYKISFSSIRDKKGIEKFKSDPAIECFLLHAKAHATGLNLVVANHVFLCEPLINTAIELQAIARVHRIGQRRATTVWMYLIADSVEESIYDISVTRRLSHIRSNQVIGTNIANGSGSKDSTTATGLIVAQQETAIDMANSLELQAADLSRLFTTGKTGGEMVENSDLWPCLFSRVKKREAVMGTAESSANGTSAVEFEAHRFLRAEAAEGRAHE